MREALHRPRRGWLKNGNPPGDFTTAARCGAKNRRWKALPSPAMRKRSLPTARGPYYRPENG